MGLPDTVSWYQRKIGTYDKQRWEKTVEQRILTGWKHVLKKTAKLKTDLIDVDLVRGSSFAKAKPKHGLLTVTKFAIIRWIFLPFYGNWWIQQTCKTIFSLLLFLYLLQFFNIFLYFYYSTVNQDFLQVSAYEVVVPAAMMLVLSLIHSEIVSTNGNGHDSSTKRSLKRSRRVKRRLDKSRQSSFDSKVENTSDHSTSTFRPQPDKTPVLRRRIAWENPLREETPSPVVVEDDGFESLNSHGSSEDVPRFAPTEGSSGDTLEWRTAVGRRRTCATECLSCEACDPETDHKDTDSESPLNRPCKSASPQRLLQRRRGSHSLKIKTCSYDSSGESDMAVEEHGGQWLGGITTNSEECSVTSDVENSSGSRNMDDHPFAWEFQLSPSSTLSPSCASSDRVSCTIWEDRDVKRADLSVLDISSAIIARVESMPENMDYFYGGLCASAVIAFIPSLCRLIEVSDSVAESAPDTTALDVPEPFLQRLPQLFNIMLGDSTLEKIVIVVAMLERFALASLFFFLVAVAERTFKQRFLYAKLFSQLTSFRRARKSELPHFRLNKVRNIKTWLSVRSYLKKRGPQRSVDVIVSAAFIITLLLLSFLSVELLKDSVRLHSEYNLEALVWCLVLGVFLLRFMTLGNKTNRKYRNLSVLLTEQINLYLQIEQKPNKKEELMVANSVLKLAADLLKELESPFKISGLSTNPYLYTITKVVILSALSGVLSEMLGFKLKLHKIKIK